MKISIFGLGYVGAVSSACFGQLGHQVIGVDSDRAKVDLINQGKSPIIERNLDSIIFEQHRLGRIAATDKATDAVKATELSLICVGTPSTANGHLDLSSIYKVAEEIGAGIGGKPGFHTVAIRSTVLPGTNDQVAELITGTSGKVNGKDFSIVSNPEFLREGSAVKDFYSAPFTLIGARYNDRGEEVVKRAYEGIQSPVKVVDIKVAETIKYVNNAFHALKITFANEIGNICKSMGIDSHALMEIFCLDHKLNLSPYYLKPGFAYGGSCLPKDLKGLVTMAHDAYLDCPVIRAIEGSNESQKRLVLDKIVSFGKRKIGFLGLTFKAETDDLRNSPIVDVIEHLIGKGFEVAIFDQNVHLSKLIGANKKFILERIPLISQFIKEDMEELVKNSEVIVVVNNEPDFSALLSRVPPDKFIYDLVNVDYEGRVNSTNYEGISW